MQDIRMCQKKVWNEWDSLFFAIRRNLWAMRVVNWRCRLWLCGGCCKRDWKWSRIVFTCSSFFSHFGTRCITTDETSQWILNGCYTSESILSYNDQIIITRSDDNLRLPLQNSIFQLFKVSGEYNMKIDTAKTKVQACRNKSLND
jgi:hypothetical protein